MTDTPFDILFMPNYRPVCTPQRPYMVRARFPDAPWEAYRGVWIDYRACASFDDGFEIVHHAFEVQGGEAAEFSIEYREWLWTKDHQGKVTTKPLPESTKGLSMTEWLERLPNRGKGGKFSTHFPTDEEMKAIRKKEARRIVAEIEGDPEQLKPFLDSLPEGARLLKVRNAADPGLPICGGLQP